MTVPMPADFKYSSHFVEVLGSKMHYVEHGSGEARGIRAANIMSTNGPGSRGRFVVSGRRSRLCRTWLTAVCACAFTALCVAASADEDVGLLELVNYYEYSTRLLSSGQPTVEQFKAVQAAGVEAVINLAPADSPDAFANEGEIVRGLGMAYTHIPVNWETPPLSDVDRFLAAMDSYAGKRVLVHCYANARASAFVYLYRVLRAGHDDNEAHATLVSIWDNNPGYELNTVGQWRALIGDALKAHAK